MSSEVVDPGVRARMAARGFLGWPMVGVAFVAQFVANGLTLAVIGNFVGPVSSDFGVSPSLIGIAPGLALIVMGVMGPLVGRALDSGWTRQMMTLGAMLTGVGLVVLSRATEIWQLGVCYVLLVALGASMFGSLPSMALVTTWFVRRRGFALGLAVAGATLASWVAPATAQWIIDEYDWRRAAFAFGVFTLMVGVPTFAMFVVPSPEVVGQAPDGDDVRVAESESAAAEVTSSAASMLPIGELVRDARLWLAAVGFALVLTSPVVLTVILVRFGESLGFTGQEATAFFLSMVPFSLAGKVVIGGLADVAPLRPSILLIVVVNVIVWAILWTEPSYTLFMVTGAIYGIGIGGAAPLQGVLFGRLFGRVNFGRASGLGGLAAIPLLAAANFGSQVLLGATGSYRLIFVVQIGLLLSGGALLALIQIPPAERPSA